MSRHSHLAQFMRTKKNTTVDEYVHLWRCIDITSPVVPDSRGNAPLLVTGSGTGAISTIDGDSAFTGTDGPIKLLYDDLDLDLRAGGDDYTIIVAIAYHALNNILYSDDDKGLSFLPINSTALRVFDNDGAGYNRFNWHNGPGVKQFYAYTRSGGTERFGTVQSSTDSIYFDYAVSSPPAESESLLFGNDVIAAPGSAFYWIAISNLVMTDAQLKQAYIDGRPPV